MPNQHRFRLIGFRPPDELRDKLERIAGDRNETMTDLLLRICWQYAEHYPLDESTADASEVDGSDD